TLTGAPNIQVTPHLGASTDEAQEKAGIAVARSVRLALAGDLVPDAVNVAGGIIDEYVRPGIPLAERRGQFAAGLAGGPVEAVDVAVHGELAAYDVKVLRLAALKGFFSSIVSEQVTFVNAPVLAESRGVTSSLTADERSDEYRNVVEVVLATSDGRRVSVEGTLTGPKQIEKIVGVNGQSVEVPMADHFVVMEYADRPGVVAAYGTAFGEAGINIAGMQIARTEEGGDALSIVTIDQAAPDELIERLGSAIDATAIHQIAIREL
ncbi:MAG TPA: ACT domain-containing protein, partial [Agrococcus sp.]|nr:ACT domain-containing protein [Agrococcus sp.]